MRTYTFIGKLVTESEIIEGVKGRIECLPSGDIVFLIEEDNLRIGVRLYGVKKCDLEGTTSDKRTKVIIENAYTNFVGTESPPKRIVAKFDVGSIRLSTPVDKDEDRKEWEIDFFLLGLRMARAYVVRERSSDGSRKIKRAHKTKVVLYEDTSIIFDKYFTWKDAELHGEKGDFVYSNEVARVTIPRTTDDNLKDALEKAIQNLNNLLLLMSFAQRRWVYWYRYSTFTNTEFIDYLKSYKSMSSLQGRKSSFDDFLIAPEYVEQFLNYSIDKYTKLLSTEIDLELPLSFLIAGHDRETIDVYKFLSYCLSLETLLAVFLKKSAISGENVPKRKFKSLKCKIVKIIQEEMDEDKPGRAGYNNILSRIGELNRQSLPSLTKQFFNAYAVEHADLMDIEHILGVRNALLHGRGIKDTNKFITATFHLTWLLERSFLKVLDWNEPSAVNHGIRNAGVGGSNPPP